MPSVAYKVEPVLPAITDSVVTPSGTDMTFEVFAIIGIDVDAEDVTVPSATNTVCVPTFVRSTCPPDERVGNVNVWLLAVTEIFVVFDAVAFG